MSELRAVTNLFSNIFATIVVSKWMGELTDERLRLAFDDAAAMTTLDGTMSRRMRFGSSVDSRLAH